jgi:hypothetical protein
MKIQIDGTLSFRELVDLAAHGTTLFNNGLDEKKFPIKDTSKRTIEVKLLKIAKKDIWKVGLILKEKRYRFLFIEELLFFSHFFPDKQIKYDIVSLDSFKYGNYGKLYPCLGKIFWDTKRGLKLVYLDEETSYNKTRFAVTSIT